MNWILYYQNPETTDTQGIYLKAEGEAEPWQTPKDIEEFDYWNEMNETGFVINSLTSAQKWLDEVAQMKGKVVKAVML